MEGGTGHQTACDDHRGRRPCRSHQPTLERQRRTCASGPSIGQLRRELIDLAEQVAGSLTPVPLKERLKQRITALQQVVDRHERTKTITEEPRQP
jgi:hypothetical protein